MSNYIFIFFLLITLLSALFVLWSKNILYSAFSLLLTFLGVAALYVIAGADFLGVTQIMVYVGGILVLLIFGIMLTNNSKERNTQQTIQLLTQNQNRFWGVLVAVGIFGLLFYGLSQAHFGVLENEMNDFQSSIRPLGVGLMTQYVLPFEVIGILLMVALIGAAYLTKGESEP